MNAVETYRAKDGYRWRLKAENGKIIAESGEAYTEANDAREGFDRVAKRILELIANGLYAVVWESE